ncbi:hypothetical protein VE01_10472 [Pseudogymnoascus verrucosus]|uniref:Uncharacterized protein n=1 Tax=Pseudogymnoascus verrucosus TaxID=342668 RepID=A0A1B8G724_9PEZI|nr:uncharacterized protein VE01_10472 [Pseudogymnoascus verrucosus]OBT91633.1 hypothetical protein VE01_10472 [Pseudogymnoascus verrucosus]
MAIEVAGLVGVSIGKTPEDVGSNWCWSTGHRTPDTARSAKLCFIFWRQCIINGEEVVDTGSR